MLKAALIISTIRAGASSHPDPAAGTGLIGVDGAAGVFDGTGIGTGDMRGMVSAADAVVVVVVATSVLDPPLHPTSATDTAMETKPIAIPRMGGQHSSAAARGIAVCLHTDTVRAR
ncbi:hypothetical protein MHEL_54780 [Mycolicibacterium helvum]|uniref:Uncharacterized protein n=1 Tax=Mycolicibacterium helvum TaxID=1534349 RepID=A0A7I7TFT6_9MYCO|nr:hypothetical protein MHEL_54780 [Mycolicibacterium helvum]